VLFPNKWPPIKVTEYGVRKKTKEVWKPSETLVLSVIPTYREIMLRYSVRELPPAHTAIPVPATVCLCPFGPDRLFQCWFFNCLMTTSAFSPQS
jgi:hypothetical protein